MPDSEGIGVWTIRGLGLAEVRLPEECVEGKGG